MPVTITQPTLEEGEALCPHCNGRGVISKYDLGWRSLYHDSELAALHECSCGGSGKYKIADGPPLPPVI